MFKHSNFLFLSTALFLISFGTSSCKKQSDETDRLLFGFSPGLEMIGQLLDDSTEDVTPSVVIEEPPTGNIVSEFYGEIEYSVTLGSQPTSDVTCSAHSEDTGEFVVEPTEFTFTSNNWDTPQILTVTGVDEYEIDGNQKVQLIFNACSSSDSNYDGYTPESITIIVTDNETYGIVVYPSELITTENALGFDPYEHTAVFYVVLTLEPDHDVVVPTITIGEDQDGETDEGVVNKPSLTFTPSNWDVPQIVTVTGQDDGEEDGAQTYEITLGNLESETDGYNGLSPDSVTVTNLDEDGLISVTPLKINVIEANPTDCASEEWGVCEDDISITVNGIASCDGSITITPKVSPSDTRVSFDPPVLSFSGDVNKTTTVKISNNTVEDSKGPFTINFIVDDTGGTNCDEKPVDTVKLNIQDDEGPGVRVSAVSRDTHENIPQDATFRVYLTKAPAPGTTVTIPINDEYDIKNYQHNEGYVNKTKLIFNESNYSEEQVVTINPVNDYIEDGPVQYTIALENVISDDMDYNGIDPRDVVPNNFDEDKAGYVVNTNGSTTTITVDGSTQSFNGYATDDSNQMGSDYANWQIKLNSKPISTVTLTFNGGNYYPSSSGHAHGELNTTSLVFTESNWDEYQSVTVDGYSDGTNEGNYTYTVSTSVSTSDSKYSAKTRPTFDIYSCDNDVDNWVINCQKSNGAGINTGTSETDTNGTGFITFIGQSGSCTGDITFSTISDTTEGAFVDNTVTIDGTNFNQISNSPEGNDNQVVVKGVNDHDDDGNKIFTIGGGSGTTNVSCSGCLNAGSGVCKTATSGDPTKYLKYSFNNADNEQKWYARKIANTKEDGSKIGQACIKLGSEPKNTITINADCSGDECLSVTGTNPITFSTSEFYDADSGVCNSGGTSCEKCVNVNGDDDTIADGTQNIPITFTVANSGGDSGSGGVYSDGNVTSTNVPNEDDENPPKRVWRTQLLKGELSGTPFTTADTYCQNASGLGSGSVKAFLVDDSGGERPSGGNVLIANTQYYWYSTGSISSVSDILFETGTTIQIDGNHDSTYGGFGSETFSNMPDGEYWTGINPSNPLNSPSFSGDNNNCEGWVRETGSSNETYYGYRWIFSGGNLTTDGFDDCHNQKYILCIEQ